MVTAEEAERILASEGLAPLDDGKGREGGCLRVVRESLLRGGRDSHVAVNLRRIDESAQATDAWRAWAEDVQRAVNMSVRESAVWAEYAKLGTLTEIAEALSVPRPKVADALKRVKVKAPPPPCPHPRAVGWTKQHTRLTPQGETVEKPGRQQLEEYAEIELQSPVDLTANGRYRLATGGPTKRSTFREIEVRAKLGGGFEFPVEVIRNSDSAALTLWLTVGPLQIKHAYKVTAREAA